MKRRPSNLKVLFLGNSFTARNDLPGMVARLADGAGLHLDHRLISVSGASLRAHWNRGEARREIEAGSYDAVVLQEQSTLPLKNPRRFHENVRLFAAVIRPPARMVLYMTWARRDARQMQSAIAKAYLSIASETRAAVIPAGMAWAQLLRQRDPSIVLHDRDGSHPTLAGTFLAAWTR